MPDTRTEEVAKAIFTENYATNVGNTTNTPQFWFELDDISRERVLRVGKAVEIVMDEYGAATEMEDLKETAAGAMLESYMGLPYDTAPDEVKQHWRNLAKVGIQSYRDNFLLPTIMMPDFNYTVEH